MSEHGRAAVLMAVTALLWSTGGLAIKLVTLEVRLGSVLAQLGAIVKGRALPSQINCRLEPLRAYARRKHHLAG